MNDFSEVERMLSHERYAAAQQALSGMAASATRELLEAEARLGAFDGSATEVMRQATSAAARCDRPEYRARGLEVALEAALRTRASASASELLDELERVTERSSRSQALRGRTALVFDERERARSVLESALREHPQCAYSARWLAELEYIEGHFDEALALLEPWTTGDALRPLRLAALRLMALCHGTSQRHEREAQLLSELVALAPEAARVASDRINLAFALAGSGDYGAAAEQLTTVAEQNPSTGIGRYALRRLDHLKTSEAQASTGRRLEQFPTTHQKRNFCGPAVLELCLRYLGLELGADEIASVVKRQTGTPMYEISAFLEARDILARRVAATPERVRAAIDLGYPVIVQEEYSTTSHVAVITGYDTRLGVFVAQDPMTHRPELKAYEWTEGAGYLFGNGSVVVIGRRSTVTAQQLAALDEAGLVEPAHFRELDDADRRRASAGGQDESALDDEVLEACARALAESPDYPLAWARRAWAYVSKWRGDPSGSALGEFLDVLQQVRSRFRGHEWAHQVHGSYLQHSGRLREAFVEYLQAHRADPQDAGNLDDMADCLRHLGDFAEAERRFLQALESVPTHHRALENLAALYVNQLGHLRPGAFLAERTTRWVPVPPLDACQNALEHSDEEVLARARWYTELAVREHGDNPFNWNQRGLLAALTDDFGAARAHFERSAELHESAAVRNLDARAAWCAGDFAHVATLAERLRESSAAEAVGWLWLAELARKDGRKEAAFETLREAAKRVGRARQELIEPLWEAGKQLGGAEAAAVRLSLLAREVPHDPQFVRALAQKVDDEGQRGVAIDLLRKTLELEPGDVNVRYRLGSLLSEDSTTHEEAQELLSEVLRQAPSATVVQRSLAWTYLASDPAHGLELIEAALEEGEPELLETGAALARAVGDQAQADELRRRALGAYSTSEQGRLELASYHLWQDRYDLAADLVFPIRSVQTGLDRERLERVVLTSARLSGRQLEVLDWVRELCRDHIPKHLAWEIYNAYRYGALELSARAAETYASDCDDPESALEYRINAAACHARGGDLSPLEQVASEVG